jgi:hypothetical protein
MDLAGRQSELGRFVQGPRLLLASSELTFTISEWGGDEESQPVNLYGAVLAALNTAP